MTTLLELFSGPKYAGLDASPLQRAICRAAEGMPIGDELDDASVQAHFGCDRSRVGLAMPVLVEIVAGVRSGKSFFSACGALRDVLVADCSRMKPHEVARHPIVAPTVDNAVATFRILLGIVEGSPLLRRLVVGEPTADTVTLRRPDGRVFEIVVVAAHRGGTTLRSRWLAGATLEEVALFGVESTGAVVNAEELLRAAEARVLPNTQVRIVSSPMGRTGLLHDLYREHFGKPGRVLVVHAPTSAMNLTFPLEAIEALRVRDPDAAAREFDARWIDGDTAFLAGDRVDASVRAHPLIVPAQMGVRYVAAMDSGTRGNAWTFAIARSTTNGDGVHRAQVVYARQWKGSKEAPLSPDAVLRELAADARPYRIDKLHTDRFAFDANRDIALRYGIDLVERNTADRDAAYGTLAATIASGRLELPPEPLVGADLKALRKILTPTGFRVELPRTSDGRHCDFAPSIALAVWRALAEADRDTGGAILIPRGRSAPQKDPYLIELKRARYATLR